jgi:sporulation protein YlmC with PRC-barrel domain
VQNNPSWLRRPQPTHQGGFSFGLRDLAAERKLFGKFVVARQLSLALLSSPGLDAQSDPQARAVTPTISQAHGSCRFRHRANRARFAGTKIASRYLARQRSRAQSNEEFSMRTQLAIASLLASTVLLTSVAFAQQSPPPAGSAPAATASSAPADPTVKGGQWRASKLIGLDVYNDQNEKLGDVSEVLLDSSGKVAGIVIGVGGFLGVGQRDIMVTMEKLKFVNEPMRSASPAPSGTTGTASAPPARSDQAANKWYPDHAILAGMSKDQIKSMTEFKYD